MQYKAQLAPVGPEIIKVALGRQTAEDVGEFLRKHFIHGMRQGETLCYDIESTTPDFTGMNKEGTFDAELFFDYEKMTDKKNYMPYVREDENHGIGGVNPGIGYIRCDTFGLVVRSGAETAEAVHEQTRKIPNFAQNFMCITIV